MTSHGKGIVWSLALLLVLTGGVTAQDDSVATGWQKSLVADLTITQASYSASWTGGEAGSVNWVGNLNGSAERQLSPKVHFKSNLRLSFGQTFSQDVDTKEWSKPVKSTDLIDWENVAKYNTGGWIDPYAAFRLESQFADASNDDKKLFFNPVKLTESVGGARDLYKQDKSFITTRLGAAIRQIMRRTAAIDLAVFDTTIIDGGIESVTDAELHFHEKLDYVGKLTLYKAFYNSEEGDLVGDAADHWKAVDVNWENTVNAYLTSIITVRLYTQLLFDKEVSGKGRFKETLGLGFVFRLV